MRYSSTVTIESERTITELRPGAPVCFWTESGHCIEVALGDHPDEIIATLVPERHKVLSVIGRASNAVCLRVTGG